MKKIHRILEMLIIFSLLSVNALAEKVEIEAYKADIKNSQITVTEYEPPNNIDNSNLYVKVVKRSGEKEKLIYEGPLSGYENGAFIHFDFSANQFIVMLEWGSEENEATYIIPIKDNSKINTQDIKETTEIGKKQVVESSGKQNITQNEGSRLLEEPNSLSNNNESNLIYNNEFSINDVELKDSNNVRVNALSNATLLTNITIIKNIDEELPANIFAALYSDNKLENLTMLSVNEEQTSDTYATYNLNMPIFNVSENSMLKILVWDGSIIKPYAMPLSIFAGYSIDVSTTINQSYAFPVNVSGNGSEFKVKFDNEFFSVDTLCLDAVQKITETGQASSTINITDIEDDSFTFTYSGTATCDSINTFVLNALKSGNTKISITEIRR